MDAASWVVGNLFGSALLSLFGALAESALYEVDVKELKELWKKERISPADPQSLRPAELKQTLHSLAAEFSTTLRLEEAGRSVLGREIYLVAAGNGTRRILFWSQMHGDEPTATGSLLDLLHFLGRHREDPWVADILRRYTLLCIPMLNPDGAEMGRRRNAQEIDINRDARALQTPEGRALKSVRDRYSPFLGFNLHNQNSLTTVGNTGEVATIALLAVGAQVPGAVPQASALLTRQVAAVLHEALAPFARGHISRYDESYNPRAFGDNFSQWGTPVVLVESGGYAPKQGPGFPVMLNFVGILAALNSLSTGRVANADPAVFDGLKMNSDIPIFDILLRNAWICRGDGTSLFRGDVAVRRDERREGLGEAIIADIGDLSVYRAYETIDCAGTLVTPGLIAWTDAPEVDADGPNEAFLRRGVLTIVRSVPWNRLPARTQEEAAARQGSRMVNSAILASAVPPAGAAAPWDPAPAAWFGVNTIVRAETERHRLPSSLSGDPATILPRWTSEAAHRLGIPRRGTIGLGDAADLVIWSAPPGEAAPADLAACKPLKALIGGEIIDLAQPWSARPGRLFALRSIEISTPPSK